MNCNNCDHKLTVKNINTRYLDIQGVFECEHCGTVQGTCYKGESYKIVKAFMAPDNVSFDNAFHYDLQVLGSTGIERRHGFADKETRLIIQVG